MGWLSNFGEPETRQANYTDTLIAAYVAAASGSGGHDVGLTAAAEIARSTWGRAFAAAQSDVLDPSQLEMIGRSLVSPGEIVFLRAGGELIPVASHEVYGIGARPEDWRYRITITAPSGQLTREVGYSDVCHIRLRATPDAPWQGRSAWAACPTTAALAARLESSLANEQRSGVGAVVAVPDAARADEDGVTTALANAKGAILLGDSSASQDAGTGRGASGREWQPDAVRAQLRRTSQIDLYAAGVSASILAAAGVPPASDRSEHASGRDARILPAVSVRDDRACRSQLLAHEAQRVTRRVRGARLVGAVRVGYYGQGAGVRQLDQGEHA